MLEKTDTPDLEVDEADLALIADPEFDGWDQEKQQEAQLAAYWVGCDLVESRSSTHRLAGGWPALDILLPLPWLTQPQPREFERMVVRPAVEREIVPTTALDYWKSALYRGPAEVDVRVKSFMEGWQVRGKEIVSIQQRLERR